VDLLNINKLKEALNDYIKLRVALFKLELKEHISDVLAKLIAYLIILLFASIVIFFVSLGIAFFINQQLESTYLGFMIVAGFYSLILIGVLLLLRSGKLKAIIEDTIINEQIIEDEEA